MVESQAAAAAPAASAGILEFEDIYRRNVAALYRFCLSQIGVPATAEEVTSDVFLRAHAAGERFPRDPEGSARWLFRSARNAAIDHARRSTRARRALARLVPGGSQDVAAVAETRAELRRAVAAIATLSRRGRVLVGLRVAAGLSYAEIAEITGTSEHAATVATLRALARVRLDLAAGDEQ